MRWLPTGLRLAGLGILAAAQMFFAHAMLVSPIQGLGTDGRETSAAGYSGLYRVKQLHSAVVYSGQAAISAFRGLVPAGGVVTVTAGPAAMHRLHVSGAGWDGWVEASVLEGPLVPTSTDSHLAPLAKTPLG